MIMLSFSGCMPYARPIATVLSTNLLQIYTSGSNIRKNFHSAMVIMRSSSFFCLKSMSKSFTHRSLISFKHLQRMFTRWTTLDQREKGLKIVPPHDGYILDSAEAGRLEDPLHFPFRSLFCMCRLHGLRFCWPVQWFLPRWNTDWDMCWHASHIRPPTVIYTQGNGAPRITLHVPMVL